MNNLKHLTDIFKSLSSWGCRFEDTVLYEIYCKPHKNRIMNLKDDFWESFKRNQNRRLSMITRTDIDDSTSMDVLDFVKGEYVVNVQLVKDNSYITEVVLYFKSGRRLHIYHDYDCCEDVTLIDIIGGNIDDLVGQEIVCLKSVSKSSKVSNERLIDYDGVCLDASNTWTFVTISTIKDDITLRWHGSSNGYYSERVDFSYYDENNKRLY